MTPSSSAVRENTDTDSEKQTANSVISGVVALSLKLIKISPGSVLFQDGLRGRKDPRRAALRQARRRAYNPGRLINKPTLPLEMVDARPTVLALECHLTEPSCHFYP